MPETYAGRQLSRKASGSGSKERIFASESDLAQTVQVTQVHASHDVKMQMPSSQQRWLAQIW
jgi:hypothetical protein